ncbi:MAG: DUF58 domain-containing protein [Acetobacteraceae bacterium]|nr:DUF58 domain-containing protein [Acetobacteraceae bacterium]
MTSTAAPGGRQGSADQAARSDPASLASPVLAARRAEAVAARFPPLLVAAERVATTVAQGVHGRRRVGQGDAFWQFRPFLAGDTVARIDWRQSAKSDRTFVRETEWEAAQTVWLWCDGSASMRWRSQRSLPEKVERAELLMLALACLLLRAGERVALIGHGMRPLGGRGALDLLAEIASRSPDPGSQAGLPPAQRIARHARVVLLGDLLSPLAEVQAVVSRLAATPASGHLLQVLDPAEEALPYAGRVRFEGLEQEGAHIIGRVEGVRGDYAKRLAAQREGLKAIARAAGWGFATHRTSEPPEAALLGLYTALSPQ